MTNIIAIFVIIIMTVLLMMCVTTPRYTYAQIPGISPPSSQDQQQQPQLQSQQNQTNQTISSAAGCQKSLALCPIPFAQKIEIYNLFGQIKQVQSFYPVLHRCNLQLLSLELKTVEAASINNQTFLSHLPTIAEVAPGC